VINDKDVKTQIIQIALYFYSFIEFCMPKNFSNENVIKNVYSMFDDMNISFDNDIFDKIFLKCVFESVDGPVSILKEAYRVLKLNGTMFIEALVLNLKIF